MAHKPVKTQAEGQAKDASVADIAGDHAAIEPAAGNNTEGGSTIGDAADAPDQAPPANEAGQTGGKAASDLPSIQPEAQAEEVPAWIVTCHREGGRRRAGRRWPKGETPVVDGELDSYQLVQLQGDPLFTVRPVAGA